MSDDLPSRLRALYSGEVGDVWTRVQRESPATYWEENAVLGRQDTYRALLARLSPVAGRRILDAGCGRGLLARRLAAEGARVTAVDVVERHVSEARAGGNGSRPSLAVADFRDLLRAKGAFDDVILQEVLEDYAAEEQLDLFRVLAGCGAERVLLVFKRSGPWGTLIAPLLPPGLSTTLDPVSVLRSVHRHSPYRLSHQESVRRRSYYVQVVELTLRPDMLGSDP